MTDATHVRLQRLLNRNEVTNTLTLFVQAGLGYAVLDMDGSVYCETDNWPAAAPALAQAVRDAARRTQPTESGGRRLYPLRAADHPVGLLAAHGGGIQTLAWETALWRSLNDLLGYALERRIVANETLERYREINLLYRLTSTIGASLDADEIPQLMLDECNRVIRAEAGMVLLGVAWEVKAAFGEAVHRENMARYARRLLADEARRARPAILTDFSSAAPSMALARYSAVLWTPLKINDRVLGGIILLRTSGQPVFSASDEKLMTALTTQAAIAVDNAQLHRAALDKQRLERELQLAFDVQARLMPRTVPQISGWDFAAWWQPAKEVSGDYYDFIVHESHKVNDILSFLSEGGGEDTFSRRRWHSQTGIVVADVSDKGMHAALFMALCRSTVRASTLGAVAPAEAITNANRLLCADATGGMFVTLFYARLNPATHELIYVNAGHNPPLRYLAGAGRFEELTGNGIMLGFDETWKFEQAMVKLDPGDVLAFYTDGVTEAVNEAHEQYGEQRLMDVLKRTAAQSAEQILEAIKADLQAFMGVASQFDDITLVVAKCRSRKSL